MADSERFAAELAKAESMDDFFGKDRATSAGSVQALPNYSPKRSNR